MKTINKILIPLSLSVLATFSIITTTNAACPAPPVGNTADTVIQMRAIDGNAGMGATTALDATEEGALIYDDTNNTVKVCDGTNWIDLSGGGGGNSCSPTNVQIFNATGTWTKPACGNITHVVCWGSGGGGGGKGSGGSTGGNGNISSFKFSIAYGGIGGLGSSVGTNFQSGALPSKTGVPAGIPGDHGGDGGKYTYGRGYGGDAGGNGGAGAPYAAGSGPGNVGGIPGGGGSGGSDGSRTGAGGSGGSYMTVIFPTSTLGGTESVIIGNGGTGGAGSKPGGAGGKGHCIVNTL